MKIPHTYTYTEKLKALVIFKKPNDIIYDEPYLADVEYLSIDNAYEYNIDLSFFPNVKKLSIFTKNEYKIPDNIVVLKNLNELNTVCILPDNIHLLNELEHLTLGGDAIFKVPDTIADSSVKSLVIGYYDKDYQPVPTPEFIYRMRNLENLEFRLCKFNFVNDEINNLENLKSLKFNCSTTDIENFPDISGLTNLKELRIRGENVQGQKRPKYSLFKEILERIVKLPQLEILDIGGWYPKNKKERLESDADKNSIPDIFDKFPNLKQLSIHWMKLDYLPSTIYRMNFLEELNITHNYISGQEIDSLSRSLPNTKIVGTGFNKSRFEN